MSRVAVFDLDGTLADTAPDLVGALNDILIDENMTPVSLEAGRGVSGFGGRSLLNLGLASNDRTGSEADIERLYPVFLEVYAQRLCRDTVLFEGVSEALDAIEAAGWRSAICTNKPEKLALALLSELDILHRFAAVAGADTLPVRKPDPRHVLHVIEEAGGHPEQAVMIGDTDTDFKAARNADVPVILVAFGYSPQPVHALNPDRVMQHFLELPGQLSELLPSLTDQ